MVSALNEFHAYHGRVHARTERLLPLIPADALEWSPAPGKFSFGDLIRHLAASERYMFVETAVGASNRYPGHGRDLADGTDAVMAYYRRCHEEALALLAELTPQAFEGRCTTPAGASLRVWKWLRAMLEHEVHHRGQLYLMLGQIGVVTPPLYGLTSEQLFEGIN